MSDMDDNNRRIEFTCQKCKKSIVWALSSCDVYCPTCGKLIKGSSLLKRNQNLLYINENGQVELF